MAWTVARLVDVLSITPDQALQIIGLARGTIDPFTVPAVEDWRRSCFHEPRADSPEVRMLAIDAVLGTFGTEAIWGESSCTRPVAEYCNTGDTYAPTVLYDYMAGRYRLTTMGDYVERYSDRYGIR